MIEYGCIVCGEWAESASEAEIPWESFFLVCEECLRKVAVSKLSSANQLSAANYEDPEWRKRR